MCCVLVVPGPGVCELVGWKRDLPEQEERARLLREVRGWKLIVSCSYLASWMSMLVCSLLAGLQVASQVG